MATTYGGISSANRVAERSTLLSEMNELAAETARLTSGLEALADRALGSIPREAESYTGGQEIRSNTLEGVASELRRLVKLALAEMDRLQRIA